MRAFARLVESVAFVSSRESQERILLDYLKRTPDPDRGWALAAIGGALRFPHVKLGVVKRLAASELDPVLFRLSHAYVGDLAETVALTWPLRGGGTDLRLFHAVERLTCATHRTAPSTLVELLNLAPGAVRLTLLKLATGTLRTGITTASMQSALARLGSVELAEVQEVWPSVSPPYESLFAWLGGSPPGPRPAGGPRLRQPMLARHVDGRDVVRLSSGDWGAEWKWDGLRVRLVAGQGSLLLLDRHGIDIGTAFPDVAGRSDFAAELDGVLQMRGEEGLRPESEVRRRLGLRRPSAAALIRRPARVRAYDILSEGGVDLRALSFRERRQKLGSLIDRERPAGVDLSPLLTFASWIDLAALRDGTVEAGIDGLILKRWDSPYVAGDTHENWLAWRRDPHVACAVLLYAQRGAGGRSAHFTDVTVGARQGSTFLPIGKAKLSLADDEQTRLDAWIDRHAVEKFGPVRSVDPKLVFEAAFDGVERSTRRRSGVALKSLRVRRILWDRSAEDAADLEAIRRLLPPG